MEAIQINHCNFRAKYVYKKYNLRNFAPQKRQTNLQRTIW